MKTSLRSMLTALTFAGLLVPCMAAPASHVVGIGGTGSNGLPTESFVATQGALLAAARAPLGGEARSQDLGIGGAGSNGLPTESFVASRDALLVVARGGLVAR